MVMGALEMLNEAQAKEVAINGIHGTNAEIEERIRQVMFRAADDWFGSKQPPERSIDYIYFVDKNGAFGEPLLP